ncbi:MAG TPA: asparaginase domain-containing protein [Candidatus Saccharimonadales bacterium]|nr:asparaginase domain-containing protein [Candidatus Saccharimonadales bacterium]
MRVKIFITGGTIDGYEYSSEDQAPSEKQTFIPKLLKSFGFMTPYSIEELMNKDSRFITDEDREIITRRCTECEERNIVITHGTITMVETAKYLKSKHIGKTIVLVGAMVPANQEGTDGPDNLKRAFGEVQKLPAGVYISMSGRMFEADNVRKNIEKGLFEELA